MDDIVSISNITYKRVHPDLYVVAYGNEKIGVLRGNYSTGFWAYHNDGSQVAGTYAIPAEAAEMLSLEASFRAV